MEVIVYSLDLINSAERRGDLNIGVLNSHINEIHLE